MAEEYWQNVVCFVYFWGYTCIYKIIYSKDVANISEDAVIEWEGDSEEMLRSFPMDIKRTLGFSLRRIQQGKLPVCDSRSMPSIGQGVWELKESDQRSWYRVIYLAKIRDTIHVLHAFEKDSRKTDRRDITTAKARFKAVQARLKGGR